MSNVHFLVRTGETINVIGKSNVVSSFLTFFSFVPLTFAHEDSVRASLGLLFDFLEISHDFATGFDLGI